MQSYYLRSALVSSRQTLHQEYSVQPNSSLRLSHSAQNRTRKWYEICRLRIPFLEVPTVRFPVWARLERPAFRHRVVRHLR